MPASSFGAVRTNNGSGNGVHGCPFDKEDLQ
jgi:hypothetical protein